MTDRLAELTIREMTLDDVPTVVDIDRMSFTLPWPAKSYRFELVKNPSAHLLVAEWTAESATAIAGFIGFWLLVDEAHISTLAVEPSLRGRGIGQRLLWEALHRATGLGATTATLEVRESNSAAIDLYCKFGFKVIGRRRAYYADNDEDALLMGLSEISEAVSLMEGVVG